MIELAAVALIATIAVIAYAATRADVVPSKNSALHTERLVERDLLMLRIDGLESRIYDLENGNQNV